MLFAVAVVIYIVDAIGIVISAGGVMYMYIVVDVVYGVDWHIAGGGCDVVVCAVVMLCVPVVVVFMLLLFILIWLVV